jgi:hypothetical protein
MLSDALWQLNRELDFYLSKYPHIYIIGNFYLYWRISIIRYLSEAIRAELDNKNDT